MLKVEDSEILDADWTKQIIWYLERRVASASLRNVSDERVVCLKIVGDDHSHFYVNVSIILHVQFNETWAR